MRSNFSQSIHDTPYFNSSGGNFNFIQDFGIWYWLMPLFRVRQKLKLEMAENPYAEDEGCLGISIFRPFPVPGKLGLFYVHTRSVHWAACFTSSSDGRQTRELH